MSGNSSSNNESVIDLIAMGFNESKARVALLRANGDISKAADLLSIGISDEDDGEFDLIASADPVPEVRPVTVFVARSDHEGAPDPFTEVTEGTVSEMVDSRISTFTEMGFSADQAVAALKQSNDDINEALTLLLSTK